MPAILNTLPTSVDPAWGMGQEISQPLDISQGHPSRVCLEETLTPYTGPTPGPVPLSHFLIKRNNLKRGFGVLSHPPHQNTVNGKRPKAKAEVP